jgi:pimeloyl-ACP methyl ester carboxylesterase
MMAFLKGLVFLLLLAPAAWWGWQTLNAPPPAQTLANGAYLEWVDCWFDRPLWRPMHCGRFHTAPEAGQTPGRFVLPVVYIPRPLWADDAVPVQYIAGGPGGAAWLEAGEIPFWLDWVDATAWPGDLVLYDQRGVGLSEPSLSCPELHVLRRELLPLPLPDEEAYRQIRDASRACHDRLRDEGIDFGRFTTRMNASDAIDLMRAMGFAQWDVYGVSYGSRVALEMMRQAPDALRAAVLDSPYPPEVNAELADPWLLQRAFELFGRICELAGRCPDGPAALAASLDRALDRVDRELLRLSVRDPETGRDLAVVFDDVDVAWLLFDALYQWDAIAQLPEGVQALAEGRLDTATRRLIQGSVDALLDDTISDPVASAVDCHDAGGVGQVEVDEALGQYPRIAGIKRLDWAYSPCRYWSSGAAPASFREPVESDVPTLLLAGEFDPVTPPEWAEQAARHLSRSQLFVFPAIGHGVLDSHVCAAELVRAFLEAPEAPQPPACLARL